MSGSGVDTALFRSLEEALHRPDVRQSGSAVAALLAEDFVEFGSSGRIFDKAAVVDALSSEAGMADPSLPNVLDFAVQQLATDVVLVTYRSVRQAPGGEQTVLRSSIWQLNGGRWQMKFHQGTLVPTRP